MELEDVSKTYVTGAGNGVVNKAVRRVSMRVGKGEILGIIGPNGAGKSSLFNIMSMITQRTGGDVMLLGQDITYFSCPSGNDYGIASQHNILWDCLTVDDHFHCLGSLKNLPPSALLS